MSSAPVLMELRRVHTRNPRQIDKSLTRKQVLLGVALSLGTVSFGGDSHAYELSCQGLKAYDMQKCLRARREAQEAEGEEDDVQGSKLKLKQYEQPGELITLPSGIQYREIETGRGKEASLGSKLSIRYTIYKLSSGAYFKYSSGGTPVLLYALGYGTEGKNDVGETYSFVLGDKSALPIAATLGVKGMREGGRRRVLVPPNLGWAGDDKIGPPPDTFGATRRLANNKDGPLLFEAELVRVRDVGEPGFDVTEYERVKLRSPYTLPPPPVYGKATQ